MLPLPAAPVPLPSASVPLVLAHGGPGHTWQAMVVVAGIVLMAAVLAAGVGRITVERGDDLVLPLAVAAIVSSLAPIGSELLSDAVGWGLPLLVVALVTLLLAAFTPLDVRFPAPLPMGAVALALVSAISLYPTLTAALHPPGELLPLADDSEVVVLEPADGATVAAGTVQVRVRVDGGSIGPGGVPVAQLPDDPEEAGALAVGIEEVREGAVTQQRRVEVVYDPACTVAAPCDEVTFDVEVAPGTHELTVEFTRGDGTPLAPPVRERVTVTAE